MKGAVGKHRIAQSFPDQIELDGEVLRFHGHVNGLTLPSGRGGHRTGPMGADGDGAAIAVHPLVVIGQP